MTVRLDETSPAHQAICAAPNSTLGRDEGTRSRAPVPGSQLERQRLTDVQARSRGAVMGCRAFGDAGSSPILGACFQSPWRARGSPCGTRLTSSTPPMCRITSASTKFAEDLVDILPPALASHPALGGIGDRLAIILANRRRGGAGACRRGRDARQRPRILLHRVKLQARADQEHEYSGGPKTMAAPAGLWPT